MSLAGWIRLALKGKPQMLKPGDAAPDFDTTDHTGRPLKLRDLRGRKVVLWFFPKADTPG
jgi:thioredoxin-dependent peroxiredoxin